MLNINPKVLIFKGVEEFPAPLNIAVKTGLIKYAGRPMHIITRYVSAMEITFASPSLK